VQYAISRRSRSFLSSQ